MKYIFVGDLHGKVEIAEHVLNNYPEYHKVFVGDYVDSFDKTRKEQQQLVMMLLDAVSREDVTCLIGNHEMSYLWKGMRCSGYTSKKQFFMSNHRDEILGKFSTHKWITEDILVTHAGCTKQVYEDITYLRGALSDTTHPRHYYIGKWRGGDNPYGGLYWCDYWAEFEEIRGLTQIVGHSASRPSPELKGIAFQNNCYNIDCLSNTKELLTYDTETEEFNTIIGEW